MATTRTPRITVLADGRRFIDKRYLGVRIGLRAGAVTQEQAEERLLIEIARVQCDLARRAHARPTFTDCAARYVAQSRTKRSIDVIKWHVTLLQSYIGDLEPQQIHDQTLEAFVRARLADGASATTINRSLEVVRTILNRAARSYRDADGRPWLEGMTGSDAKQCRCRKCKGVVTAVIAPDDAIKWLCPGCGQEGRIANWRRPFWDLSEAPRGRG